MNEVVLRRSDTVIVRVDAVHSLHTTKVFNLLRGCLVHKSHNIEQDIAFSCNTSVKVRKAQSQDCYELRLDHQSWLFA